MHSSQQTQSRTFPWFEHLSIGRLAFLAGVIVILTGGVSGADLQQIGSTVTLPLLSLLGLSIIALSVHEVGVFTWAAHFVAYISGGSGRRLFTNLYLLCTFITVLFPNDATILLFTPLVLRILFAIRERAWETENFIPFLFAIVFGANAASIALVTSNPVNMIFATHFGLPYLTYAAWMTLPAVASTTACYLLLRWCYRRTINVNYTPSQNRQPLMARTVHAPFIAAMLVTIGIFVSYFVLSALGIAYHWAILAGALAILWPVWATPGASLRRVAQGLPWDELLFVTGMFVIAFGLTNGGLTQLLETAVNWLAHSSLFIAALGNSLLTMIGANLINDWPMSLISSLAIETVTQQSTVTEPTRQVLAYTAVISANLGNKILPMGSLATLIWIGVIRRIAGIQISWGHFIRTGLLVTPLTLLAAVLTLWLEFYLWG